MLGSVNMTTKLVYQLPKMYISLHVVTDHFLVKHRTKWTGVRNRNISLSEPAHSNENFETEWLVCRMCERVLSTALEVEPTGKINQHNIFYCLPIPA